MTPNKILQPTKLNPSLRWDTYHKLYPWTSWFYGFIFYLSLIIIFFVCLVKHSEVMMLTFVFSIICIGLFIAGIRQIPANYVAIPVFLGTRLSNLLFIEGYYWTPIGIKFTLIEVNPRYFHEVYELHAPSELIKINLETTVYWQVRDPLVYSNASSIFSPGEHNGFHHAVYSMLRESSLFIQYDTVDLLNYSNKVGEEVSEQVNHFISKSGIDWGISINAMLFTRSVSVSEELMNRFERILATKLKAESEKVDAENLADRIRSVMNATGLRPEEAADFLLGLKGRIKRQSMDLNINSNLFQEAIRILFEKLMKPNP